MNEGFKERIALHEWKSHFRQVPKWFSSFPTMLTIEEMNVLSWLAETTPHSGAIIDLGCFIGGSSVSLAQGNSRSLSPKTIHSYDRFEISERLKWMFLYQSNHPFYEGSDALPLFKKLTAPYASHIVPHAGDVFDESFTDSISILFIDVAKNLDLHNHIGANFFLGLSAGSVIVQQDFLYFANPWLFVTMYELKDAVPMVGYAENYSVVFHVDRELTEKELTKAFPKDINQKSVYRAIDFFESSFPFLRQKEMCRALRNSFDDCDGSPLSFKYKNVDKIPIIWG